MLGSDDEEYAKKWFNLMSNLCETKQPPRRMSVEYTKQTAASPPPLNKSD